MLREKLNNGSKGMRRPAAFIYGILICAILVIALARKRNEVEQAKVDTLGAAHKIQNLNNWNGEVAESPLLALEFKVRGNLNDQDFRNHYYEEVDTGMYWLKRFNVLKERTFKIGDPNARAQFVNSISSRGSNVLWRVMDLGNAKWFGGFSQDFLWHLVVETNGTVTVVAKPGDMIAWQRLIEESAGTNSQGSLPIK